MIYSILKRNRGEQNLTPSLVSMTLLFSPRTRGAAVVIKIKTIIRQDNFGGMFKMRPERNGFTLVELLTTLAIIAMLVGILIPTVSYVRNSASGAKQKVQFAAIDMAIMAFKGDYGDYPLSTLNKGSGAGDYYCGASMLCEALLGWDLLGFHPDSKWKATANGDPYDSSDPCNLEKRIGPYLELGTASAFKLKGLASSPSLFYGTSTNLADRYVLCDSFGAKSVKVGGKAVRAGRPILYYKANTNSKNFDPPADEAGAANKIYNYTDNIDLINLKMLSEGTSGKEKLAEVAPEATGTPAGTYLYSNKYKLKDPKIAAPKWPYRPDSYILISAGADGLYGTQDDVTNF
jgi:prepilin-type N-terminal cleavage/methylation domain-containing protein